MYEEVRNDPVKIIEEMRVRMVEEKVWDRITNTNGRRKGVKQD